MQIYNKTNYLIPALVVSLVLHLSFIYTLSQPKLFKPTEAKIIQVDLVSALNQVNKKQIVSTTPTDKKPPEDTRYVSDRDSFTPKETIRRGDPLAGKTMNDSNITPNAIKTEIKNTNINKAAASTTLKNTSPANTQAQPTNPTQTKPTQLKLTKKLDLSTDYDLMADISKQSKNTNNSLRKSLSSQTNPQTSPRPFSRSPGSNAQIFGFHGSLDHLPNVTDGDITLLNAKADKFAVFVRRVAIRVFNLLKQYGWDYLSARDFVSLNRHTSIKAVLDDKGKFIKLSLSDSSGNTSFDRIVERAVSEGANDPNPPPAAKTEEGNYQFIFQARTWSQIHPGGRSPSGRPTPAQERRWLMLQTGLE